MIKLRLYSKNSVRFALNSLILIIFSLFLGCSSSTAPTFLKEDIDKAIRDICRDEYKIDVKARWAGSTLWIYLPLEDILEKSNKPQKFLERFSIEQNKQIFRKGYLWLEYLIKTVPEQEKSQDEKYSEAALKKVSSVWRVIRRTLFSMETSKEKEPEFICFVTTDVKNGFSLIELVYYPDLKKVSYDFISFREYQHRSIQETQVSPQIISDKDGSRINYREISFEEFIGRQIQFRIKLKFQKPEVTKDADIDKEILKIISYTLKAYGYKDFSGAELNNLLTNNKTILSRKAILEQPSE